MEKAKIKQTNKTNKFTKKNWKRCAHYCRQIELKHSYILKLQGEKRRGGWHLWTQPWMFFLGMISAIEHCWVFKIFNAIIFFFGKNTLHTINWKIQHWYVFYCIFYVTRVWSYQGCVYVSQLKSQLISAWSQPNELVGGMMRKTTQQSVTH